MDQMDDAFDSLEDLPPYVPRMPRSVNQSRTWPDPQEHNPYNPAPHLNPLDDIVARMDSSPPIATVDQMSPAQPAQPAQAQVQAQPAQPAQPLVAQGVRVQASRNKNGKQCPKCKQLSPNAVNKCKQPVMGGTCGYVWRKSKSKDS